MNASETGAGSYQVVVNRSPAYPDADLMRVLDAQPQTRRVIGGTRAALRQASSSRIIKPTAIGETRRWSPPARGRAAPN